MGEVRVNVRITNGTDEVLVKLGQLKREQIRAHAGEALVDTGSVKTIIPASIVEKLGLAIMTHRPVRYADGRVEDVPVTGSIRIYIESRETFDEAYVLGNEILIGQIALESMDLHVDCNNRKLLPNPNYPDRPVLRV